MQTKFYPLHFKPVYKDYIWGGDRIIKTFGREEPDGIYAESWEITDRPEGMSVVTDGPLAGKSIHELIVENAHDILGTHVHTDTFPLLIKLIDSRQRLSVQVHPNDENAHLHNGQPKTEMWHILGADPDAQIFAGLKETATRESFQVAIENNTFEDVLPAIPVESGDTVFIPGGRVHAIDAGCLVLEVQQNSNTTYRIYDWGRVGNDGKPRELHIQQALDVINWDDSESPVVSPTLISKNDQFEHWAILKTPYFEFEKLDVQSKWCTPHTPETFQILFVAAGKALFEWDGGSSEYPAGTSILIPAALHGCTVKSSGDKPLRLLRIMHP